ncbi:hypothetical protein CVT26_014713 [Gymnopilus dilepis]|uniref:ATP-dependent DNA ligase family profile domain-containing protein n=1 Tax=Gymnopilus dilepis TaxID=231916 RepID=A0A409VX01_9AGAR|nr:hypothetical protein CVT26_014713 [Gymnopilus dilepis]
MADELAEIDGIKPNIWLDDGQEREVSSQTSSSVYKVKRTGDHYYWRGAIRWVCYRYSTGGSPINARTCKHLKSLLGEKYELARLRMKNPDGPQPKAGRSKAPSKAKSTPKTPVKRKRPADEEEDDDEEIEDDDSKAPPAKRGRKTATSSSKGKEKQKTEEGAEEEDNASDDAEGEVPAGKSPPELLLATKWDIETGPDPTGWWMSEKLDGVRTFYDGTTFISRLGNAFTPPNWFLDKLPKDLTLDGELYGGRGTFQSTVSIVKTVNSVHWKNISFQIFDIPSRGDEPFEQRYEFLQKMFGENGTHATDQICVVQHEVAKDREHVLDKLKEVESVGGEGLMLRKPGSVYEGRRSGTLLKIKTFYDAEAIVTGYAPGKGRNKGITGALKCRMESGKLFNVGSGLSDKIRRQPPPIGSIITYRFQELTRDGVPRFPSYVGVAADKDQPKDAEIPEHRRAGTSASGAA